MMTVDRALRMLAGAFVLITLALAYWVSPWWLLFTAFVGLNLLQSAFTNWCPAMAIFRWMGLPESCATKPPDVDRAVAAK
jgi:DUF2892 family protein